ncbi:DUF1993 family protein [cf. Phormidesmis sp. LEGE 11477]|uniref:DUF1993 domain-containing protein n=1 Tax=cf. Phormidesmis sp. LEGE 11477 TaxID=1828680 RepID=UPI00187FF2BD|nr:DUF1993 domain-containing protein [cf. Phormidesmis sp. LEGE 11477]MBE9064210.1 DUF1993 domain-containing protein [cf. Phormidesmis sp. LEGE 11477]
MPISMYQASVPLLRHQLKNLIGILEKAATYAEEKSIDQTVLTSSRLYPDMFPLTKQVQIASDMARRGVARLASVEPPPLEDTEITFPELIDRLQKSIDYLETFSADQIDGTEEKEIIVPTGKDQNITMKGWPFLAFIVMPNAHFHVTTAYDILRHNGVEIGKRDYLGSPD